MMPFDEFDRLVKNLLRGVDEATRDISVWQPFEFLGNIRVDVIDKGTHYIVVADLPGVGKEDIEITASGNYLNIEAKKVEDTSEEKEGYIHKERSEKKYYRRILLPDDANMNVIDAKYQNGVLRITIPKKEGLKKKVSVE